MTVLLGDMASRNSVSIRTELDLGLPTATADRVQLQQVLMNLMLNGVEAMKDTGGELTVTSRRTEGDQLLISVSDLGIGLPSEDTERIFGAFFTTKPQGTGMGMSLSRRIIEAHGGRLWASPNDVRGRSSSSRCRARRRDLRADQARRSGSERGPVRPPSASPRAGKPHRSADRRGGGRHRARARGAAFRRPALPPLGDALGMTTGMPRGAL